MNMDLSAEISEQMGQSDSKSSSLESKAYKKLMQVKSSLFDDKNLKTVIKDLNDVTNSDLSRSAEPTNEFGEFDRENDDKSDHVEA